MEEVYMVAVVFFVIFWCWFTYKCCMSGYTTKKRNPDDYMEINKKQKDNDIAKIKAQDKYDNEWGML